jgi:hypothetical protein
MDVGVASCRSRDGAAAGPRLDKCPARQERCCSPSHPARGPEPRSRAGSRAPPDDEPWVDDEVEFVDGAVGDLVEQELSARTPTSLSSCRTVVSGGSQGERPRVGRRSRPRCLQPAARPRPRATRSCDRGEHVFGGGGRPSPGPRRRSVGVPRPSTTSRGRLEIADCRALAAQVSGVMQMIPSTPRLGSRSPACARECRVTQGSRTMSSW